MKLQFHAIDTTAEADDEVADCGFTGDGGRQVGLMSEEGGLVRIAWSDGRRGEDEGVVALARVELWRGRVRILLTREGEGIVSLIPYDELELTWDDADERSVDLADVFSRLLSHAPDRLVLHLDE